MVDDDFWQRLENEPCDSCGARPSKHEGHGAFTCRACYEARWCPKCTYALGPKLDEHVCPSPAVRAKNHIESELFLASLEADFCEKTVIPMAHRIDELEDTIRWIRANEDLHSSCGRNEVVNRVLEDIDVRRGKDWTGAYVSGERVSRTTTSFDPAKCDHGAEHAGHFEFDWCENCDPERWKNAQESAPGIEQVEATLAPKGGWCEGCE